MFVLLKEEPTRFLSSLRESLYNLICFDLSAKERLERLGISRADASEKFPLSIECNGFANHVPKIIDLSRDATPYVNKLCKFYGRFLNTGLELRIEYEETWFKCSICGKVFEMLQNDRKFGEQYKSPYNCISPNCKAKGQRDFKLDQEMSKSREIRTFSIGDNEITKPITIKCVILQNIPYFIEAVRDINIEERVELTGFLRVDSKDINHTRKEDYEFSYYIETTGIKKVEDQKLDLKIINDLKSKIQENPNFIIDLINDFYPYTKYIYESFIAKLLICLSWVTSNAFRKGSTKRNSINLILGGHTGTVKTSEIDNYRRILGANQVLRLSSQEITGKGLVPTSSRANNEKDLVLRYGPLRYQSRKLLVLDEAQYLTEIHLQQHKVLEEGRINKATDGSIIDAEAEGSVIHLINYVSNEDEKFDYKKKLLENLPKNYRAQPSILERMDSHFAMPPISETINELLSLRSFEIPEKEFSEVIDLNYLQQAKILYTEFNDKKIDKGIRKKINEIASILDKKSKIRTPRQRKILVKYIKAIACLHLRDNVIEDDLDFLKKHLAHTIIPFYDNPAISTLREPEMDRIFQWTLRILIEIKDEIYIPDHVNLIRECLRNNFFPGNPEDSMIQTTDFMDNFMPDAKNTRNSKYITLLERNAKFIESLNLIQCQIKTKTAIVKKDYYLINKSIIETGKEESKVIKEEPVAPKVEIIHKRYDLANYLDGEKNEFDICELYSDIKDMYELNNFGDLEKESILQALSTREKPAPISLINEAFKIFEKREIIQSVGKKVKWNKTWQ